MKITKDNYIEFNEVSLLTNFQDMVSVWATINDSGMNNETRTKDILELSKKLKDDPENPLIAGHIMVILLEHAHINGYDLMTIAQKVFKNLKYDKSRPYS